MIKTITGNSENIHLFYNKTATFMLALSNTATADIPGITQAGIPGMIYFTPTLDGEFVASGAVHSMPDVAETPNGVPTPALITRSVHLLHPFAHIALLDLGLRVPPGGEDVVCHDLSISPSQNIADGADIDAKALIEKGMDMGRSYVCEDDYLIVGESVPSGTTTATATALALGYDAQSYFSSSFKHVPDTLRHATIQAALARVAGHTDMLDILGSVADNMLLFVAGFVLGVNGRFPVVLAGGTQMAAVLLVANRIAPLMDTHIPYRHLALWTTKWVAEDPHSNIKKLLEMVDTPIDAYYADFDFGMSRHPALALYDEGEAKEGVGAGGAIVYAYLHGVNREDITRQVEEFLK